MIVSHPCGNRSRSFGCSPPNGCSIVARSLLVCIIVRSPGPNNGPRKAWVRQDSRATRRSCYCTNIPYFLRSVKSNITGFDHFLECGGSTPLWMYGSPWRKESIAGFRCTRPVYPGCTGRSSSPEEASPEKPLRCSRRSGRGPEKRTRFRYGPGTAFKGKWRMLLYRVPPYTAFLVPTTLFSHPPVVADEAPSRMAWFYPSRPHRAKIRETGNLTKLPKLVRP